MNFSFKVLSQDSDARRGEIITKNGKIQTPFFMPVGTYGAVKGISPLILDGLKAEILLSNTFHLMERPGIEVIKKEALLLGMALTLMENRLLVVKSMICMISPPLIKRFHYPHTSKFKT